MPVIDSHQHFWIRDSTDYPWLIEEHGPIFRDFEPAELKPQLDSAGVDATIIVQSANSYKDTDAMLAQAAELDWITGVVGWVPLTDRHETRRKLDEDWLTHPKFCGIRHLNHDESDAAWVVREDVLTGLAELEARSVAYEIAAVFPDHLEHVPALAKARTGLRIVIDHLAKPPIASGDLSVWREQMTAAADYPNVFAKISGLNTVVGGQDWGAADLIPPIEHCIDVFGVNRLMFGSDWPVALFAGTYERVFHSTLSAFDQIGLNGAERASVLGDTARRVYELGEVE